MSGVPDKKHEIARLKPAAASPRRAERAAVPMPVTLRIASVEDVLTSKLLNVSKSGAFVAMGEPPPLGTLLDLEVYLENGLLLLHAAAEVVRHNGQSEPRGVGARFIDISFESQVLIDRLAADQRLLGDYRLEALLGRGGMAEVYRAHANFGPRAGYRVALKRIRPELTRDATITALFEQEAELAPRLAHPGIVEVYETGAIGDVCFIAMELVEGCDLRQLIQACSEHDLFMPEAFGCFVVCAVAEALHHAHSLRDDDGELLGLVHRDIAPSNVFISNLGEIKLGDFGVAHLVSQGVSSVAAGKLPYMAPEQIEDGEASPASDVWSLGVVLFETLTNRRPFEADSERRLMRAIARGEAQSAASLRPDLSPQLLHVLSRALALEVDDGEATRSFFGRRRQRPRRYATAAQFASDLAKCFDPGVGTPLGIAGVIRTVLGK